MLEYETIITIILNIILATTCSIALWTIRRKTTPSATSFDFTLGHTFFSQTLFSLTTTVSTILQYHQQQHGNSIGASICTDNNGANRNNTTATIYITTTTTSFTIAKQRKVLWEHVVTATSMMFLQNSFIFITLTSVQQFLAVYFPFKIKSWVTRRRTNIFFSAAYTGSMIFHVTIFLTLGYGSVAYMNAVGCGFWSMSGVMVTMYAALSFKLITRACTRTFAAKSRTNNGQSRTAGNFQDKKTVAILLFTCSGALCSGIALLVKQQSGYGMVVLIGQYMQWIIAPSVFIFVNRNVFKRHEQLGQGSNTGHSTNHPESPKYVMN